MKRIIFLLISSLLLLSFSSCQSDFSKPADYVFDTKNEMQEYILELSGVNTPGTSKTFVFEVKNSTDAEAEYELVSLVVGGLPLSCSFSQETADGESRISGGASVLGSIGKNEKHRYTLTVIWPAEEKSYIYAGELAYITVAAYTKK